MKSGNHKKKKSRFFFFLASLTKLMMNFAELNVRVMTISVQECDNLTITAKVRENASCEELIIAALDVISRIYSQEQVICAYENVDPDGMCVRD
jgi:hypothetical protein